MNTDLNMNTVEPLHLAVVSAGLSVPSSTRLLADRLTESVREQLADAGREVEVHLVELRDLAVDIANNLVTGFPSPTLEEAIETVTSADGLIAVTPVFSASYSGLFKSFFDVIDNDALTAKPVLAAATGGTARHSLALEHALRPLFAYLRTDRRTHNGVRGLRGLGRQRRPPHRHAPQPDPARGRRAGRPDARTGGFRRPDDGGSRHRRTVRTTVGGAATRLTNITRSQDRG